MCLRITNTEQDEDHKTTGRRADIKATTEETGCGGEMNE